ncbi:dockerin type I domain-containing protein [Lacipirellula sp.]|uniref:dockerin type I domain-containing protein n=1 Tax=Lacipirellula sp. TaxID=2691419 RepID=UPI003D11FAB3
MLSRRLRALAVSLAPFAAACSPAIAAEDPNGIYILSTAVNNPNTPQDDRLGNIRDYDFVSGYTLRLFWNDLETSPGVYNFNVINEAVNLLAPLNQGLSLEIFTGEEPQYVLDGAAAKYTDHRGGLNPVPWDAFAQSRHAALYSALGDYVVTAGGSTHALRDDPTLRSIDAAPVGLNFGVRDLNGAIRAHPDYTQQRYVDSVAAGVATAAAAFPHDQNFLAFFAFNDSQPGLPVDEQLIARLAPLYNGPGQPGLAFFIENLSDDGPLPQPNGMGAGNNLLDWSNLGGPSMIQTLDSWLVHRPERDAQLDSRNPATGIELAYNAYRTRFFELYVADIDGAMNGALDAAGQPIIDDLRAWHSILTQAAVSADFDGNGVVDAADLAIWKQGFGNPGSTLPEQGDANGDGIVDGADFLDWQRQAGGGNAALAAVAVPEPAAMMLALIAAGCMLRMQRRLA